MRMEIDSGWHEWKNTLGKFVHGGKAIGFSEKRIENMAKGIGDFFADHFDPGNREQRLLKELWEQGNDNEKQALASLMTRMVTADKNEELQ